MRIATSISGTWQQVPVHIRSLLTRAFFIFEVWKLVYHLLLFPIRFPDKQLTDLTAASTAFLYKHLLNEPLVLFREELKRGNPQAVLYVEDNRAIGIADSCNGLELYVLFIAFLFCIPSSVKRQLAFTFIGIGVIFVSNAFRCFGLAYLFLHDYSWANFAHHYLFKMIIYSMMFFEWVLYVKKSSWYAH